MVNHKMFYFQKNIFFFSDVCYCYRIISLTGGSPCLAAKINEAKDMLDKSWLWLTDLFT